MGGIGSKDVRCWFAQVGAASGGHFYVSALKASLNLGAASSIKEDVCIGEAGV